MNECKINQKCTFVSKNSKTLYCRALKKIDCENCKFAKTQEQLEKEHRYLVERFAHFDNDSIVGLLSNNAKLMLEILNEKKKRKEETAIW